MIELTVIFLCLALNALLACIEMAFVSVGRPQLRQLAAKGNADARRLLGLRNNPERTLSIIQIGITLVGAISAAVGGAGAEETLQPWLRSLLGISESAAETIAITIVVLPITFLSVVVGELAPKTIALRNPMPIALLCAHALSWADQALSPIVAVLEWCTKLILRPFHRRMAHPPTSENSATAEEIDTLSDHHRQYVANLVHLEKKRIRDILVPWSQVSKLESTKSALDVAEMYLSSTHSRLPVIDGECVLGFLYAREFTAFASSGGLDWHTLIRPLIQVKEGDSILRVMRLMQEKRNHISLVQSQTGTNLGIVTLEDIIEEVVGEIYDEDDDGNLKRVLAEASKTRQLLVSGKKDSSPLHQALGGPLKPASESTS